MTDARRQLAHLLRTRIAAEDGSHALSHGQRALWLTQQLDPGSPVYNVPVAVRVRAHLDDATLRRTLQALVDRHPALRSVYVVEDGLPMQRSRPLLIEPTIVDAAAWTPDQLRAAMQDDARSPFDLERGPIFRASLFRLAPDDHALLLTFHHIAVDMWSVGVLLDEFRALYDAEVAGRRAVLPPGRASVRDFVQREQSLLAGSDGERLWDYWKDQLSGELPVLDLPTDRPRPRVQTYRGGTHRFEIGPKLTAALRRLAGQAEVTLNTTLLAGFAVLLSRHTGQKDVLVGTPTANRDTGDLAATVGYLVNPVAMRSDLSADPTFLQLLRQVGETAVAALEHQAFPFGLLVERLGGARDPGRPPVFQTMFVLQKSHLFALDGTTGTTRVDMGGLVLETIPLDDGVSPFDLDLQIVDAGRLLACVLRYSTNLFDAETMARLAGHYLTLLEAAVADPSQRVSRLPLLSREGRDQVLQLSHGGPLPASGAACLHDLVGRQAARTPAGTAVVTDRKRMTYAELDRRANQLARHLRERGVRRGSLVGVCLPRTADLVVALLATLRAGGAYLPLDPAYPPERLALMLTDARASLVVTEQKLRPLLDDHGVPVVCLGLEQARIERESPTDPGTCARPDDLAYVIYTSGSTGRPNGVAIEHRNAAALVAWARTIYTPAELAGVLAATSVCFDLSVFEIFVPLACGGTVLLVDDALALPGHAAAGQVTLVNTVPSAMEALLRHDGLPGSVRVVNLAGEPLPSELAQALYARPGVERVFNLYGPSEDTTYSTWELVPRDCVLPPTIGRPIAGREAYILDEAGEPVPLGVVGELYLAGAGLARGYLHRPELTADRFGPHPLDPRPAVRAYRTGDLARRLPDGRIVFLGRRDHQVKLRGFRIELGEVEAALRRHPHIRAVAVVVREDVPGDRRLVAYGVGDPSLPDPGELRRWLLRTLPDAMIPSAFVSIDELPLTPNRKLDRGRLPAPEVAPAGTAVVPRTPVIEILAGIFADVLGLPDVDITQDFFELGGHSLLATQVASRARDVFQVDMPVRAVFEAPSVVELAGRIEHPSDEPGMYVGPAPAPRGQPMVLSPAQQRLWFLEQLQPGRATYNIAALVELGGALDVDALEQSLQAVVERHGTLRTSFEAKDGVPVQRIATESSVRLVLSDLSTLPPDERETEAGRLTAAAARRPFDLGSGPLLRTELLRLAPKDHRLVIVLHHIVADGWSLGVLVTELAAFYSAHLTGGTANVPELPLQYADFAAWQHQRLESPELDATLRYWCEHLADSPPSLPLPTDHPRPLVQSDRGGSVEFELPAELVRRLRSLSRAEGASLFMSLLTAFQLLLARFGGQDDMLVGVPIANRTDVAAERLIGFFVNTLPIRTRVDLDDSFSALLRQVREVTLDAYAHQEVPFDRVVQALHPDRDLSRQPLIDVLFVLQNLPLPDLHLPALRVRSQLVDTDTAKFDLNLLMHETGAGVSGRLEYSTDLFDRPTIEQLSRCYVRLLEAAADAPQTPAGALPLLADEDRDRIRHGWSATPDDRDRPRCIHERAEEQAKRTPASPALEWSGGSLSYSNLDKAANRLAHRLAALGIRPNAVVGLCLDRGPDALVAVLAVLKAGGACLPLDPDYPPARLRAMVEHAQPSVVLTAAAAADRLPASGARVVVRLDLEAEAIAAEPSHPVRCSVGPDDLAYVIYTSGTTATPKGVAMPHRALDNLATWQIDASAVPRGRTLQFAPLSFDVFFQELAATWAAGGTLVLADDDARRDPHLLLEMLTTCRIERLFLPWVALDQLAEASLGHAPPPSVLREVITAGEQVRVTPAIRRLFERLPDSVLVNQYGPCETHVVTSHTLEGRPEDWPLLPPIGRAIANTRVYVLDARLEPVPPGIVGEIYLGGAGLAHGYLGQPALTGERFITPAAWENTRLYRTGDLGRYVRDGTLEWVGRLDTQVKIRGFRVEPAEIESQLERHPGVRRACVVARPGDRVPRLVAYIVGEAGQTPTGAALRRFAAEHLPAHMVPSAFTPLDVLPLTPSGKLDRRALPAPGPDEVDPAGLAEPPRTPTEELLTGIFAEVLGLASVGATTNFFDVGGHSLLATRVLARVRRALGADLPVRALFEAPTARGLAEVIVSTDAGSRPRPVPAPVDTPPPLSFAQERLWFLDRLQPGSAFYNLPAAVRVRGRLDVTALRDSLGALAERHQALRTTFDTEDDHPVQVIAASMAVELDVEDHSASGLTDADLERLGATEARRPFDLVRGPLWRARLVKVAEDDHALFLSVHHVIADGWSLGILVTELGTLYRAHLEGAVASLPPLGLRFSDYARWQRELADTDVLAHQAAWWRNQLDGAPPALALPTDRPRPAVQRFRGATVRVALPAPLTDSVTRLARREGATPYMVLLAAFQLLLSRLSRQTDVVVGVPHAGRNWEDVEGVVGLFVNTLPIRTRVDPDESFSGLIGRVREFTLAAYARQDVPFERLVQDAGLARELDRSPLFQAMFALQNTPPARLDLPGLTVQPIPVDSGTARFDLTLSLEPGADGLGGSLTYNTDLFDRITIERLVDRYARLLGSLTDQPGRPVAAHSLLSAQERDRVLVEWNDTVAPVPDRPVHELVAEQAARTPDAVAVSCRGVELSYAELDRRSGTLAGRLRSHGVGPGVLAGICLYTGLDSVTAMLAVLKAGGAYVPLDPGYPRERLALMLADAAPRVVLTDSVRRRQLPDSIDAIAVDAEVEADEAQVGARDVDGRGFDPEDLAYVIYTSGSTGRPKGVMVPHQALTNLTSAFAARFSLAPGDRVLMVPSISFDASVGDIFPALTSGATLIVHPAAADLLGARLEGVLVSERITVLDLPAAPWQEWLAVLAALDRKPRLGRLRLVITGGESLPAEAVREFRQLTGDRVDVIAPYGPTEATVCTTLFHVRGDVDLAPDRVPLGRPLPNTRVYVLDRAGQPVPVGVVGEIHIAGAGLARGYLGQPELTAERFMEDPFDSRPGARLFRTGDLARHLPDGNLVFAGRVDEQLKLRGFRIEPGEVEAHLSNHPGVGAAAVAVREMGERDRRLVAFVVPSAPQAPPTAVDLRKWLAERLPAHMVPAAYVRLVRLPLTPNGKVDRAALPEASPLGSPVARVAPRGAVERLIAETWRAVLAVDDVGRDDNFFDLGGNSLLLVRVQDRLTAELGRELRMVELFEHPTVALLAAHLANRGSSQPAAVREATERAAHRRRARRRRTSASTSDNERDDLE
jgi:amino acid adenylation domain-containing protein